ncbi:MAG: electron transfer flavoprotein subunit alpha/FixB family protein [Desulfovibrionaceae bacterium]
MNVLFIATADNATASTPSASTPADGGVLPKASLEALSAAKDLAAGLGGSLFVGLVGSGVDAAAVAGAAAAKVFVVDGPDFAQPRYSSDVAALAALCREAGAEVVVGAHTSRLARALPGVAQRLGGRVDTQLTGLEARDGGPVATRWFYRQRMHGEVVRQASAAAPWVLTVSPGVFAPFEADGSAVEAVAVAVSLSDDERRTATVGVEAPAADAQTIRPDAELLLVAGAGWTKKQADGQPHVAEARDLILGFLEKTKASLGSSKSLVDLGGEGVEVLDFLTHMHQVGQTGATPRHKKGLATCCHGEEPHVVGWRFISERRAVNLDAGCGWAHGKTDVLYVGDAFAVMQKLGELL